MMRMDIDEHVTKLVNEKLNSVKKNSLRNE
jgi:hypothetical protein